MTLGICPARNKRSESDQYIIRGLKPERAAYHQKAGPQRYHSKMREQERYIIRMPETEWHVIRMPETEWHVIRILETEWHVIRMPEMGQHVIWKKSI